ncbi:MAG: hypothetical protein IJW55_05455 [Clostridia bacterium]|nr:hypothetical protein [Clostridia bacterium]
MQYKVELHAHTAGISTCARMEVKDVADQYLAAGYSTLILTNHYVEYNFDNDMSWEESIRRYLAPIHEMQAYVGNRMTVLPGAEVRNYDTLNDYLILGADEEFFLKNRYLHRLKLKAISRLVREHGALLIQAHPFRNGMSITNPSLLDGVEVFNGAPGQNSRNNFAYRWAKAYGFLQTSGSDFHGLHTPITGGILTNEPVNTSAQVVKTIREGNYDLICTGPAAERDDMHTMPAKQ